VKVLIADDSAMVRERLASLISELEAVELIGQTEDASETLRAVRQLRPDVVILDIHIPGDGIQVLEAIKKDARAPLVIILTAFSYPQYRRRCLEAGAEYFFDKATEFDRVVEVLRHLSGDTAH
jgi:DNA-binding NarL/FixJ family response regulator